MKINPSIFKAYDIRGVYPSEINEEIAYKIGRAFANFLNKAKLEIVVGQDNRLSSPSLFKALIKGITDGGADVIDIGLSTTPMFYFTVAHYKFDGGIEITASHNPPQYNGFKFVRENAIPISEKSGLGEIKNFAEKFPANFQKVLEKGKIIKKNITPDYLKFNLKIVDITKIKPLKIVIDTANAVPGVVVPKIFESLPGKIYYLFQKLDGNFPNHPPDPLVKGNLRFLQKEAKDKKANLGIAFDGDGDRIIFVDETGEVIPADLITALISSLILKSNPGEKILYDIRSSDVVKEVIKKRGGTPIMGRIGHSFIKEKMRKENIIFAGEFSGHYYLKTHYFCETPFFVIFKILEELSKTKKKFSELMKPFRKYYHSGEINFEIEDKEQKIKEIERLFRGGKVLYLDGLRIDYKDWWFNLRPSHTQPVLRLVIEAKTKKLLEEKKKEIKKLIKSK